MPKRNANFPREYYQWIGRKGGLKPRTKRGWQLMPPGYASAMGKKGAAVRKRLREEQGERLDNIEKTV